MFVQVPNFAPIHATVKVQDLPKLKFLLTFDQNVEYKSPTGPYPLHIFHKICTVCTLFQDVLAVKILLDFVEVMELWGFQVDGVQLPPDFQRPLAVNLCITPPKVLRCKNVFKVFYHHAKFGGAWMTPTAEAAKNIKIILSVCLLSVRHAFERQSLCA